MHHNSVGTDGGGIAIEGDHKKIILNSNIVSNTIPQTRYGGGLNGNANADSLLIMNSILYGNNGNGDYSGVYLNGTKIVAFNSYFRTGNGPGGNPELNFVRGSGNIFSDDNPFVTYDLANNSQAIGQGKSSIQFDGETITPHVKDFFGNDRLRPVPIQIWVLWKMIYQNPNIIGM